MTTLKLIFIFICTIILAEQSRSSEETKITEYYQKFDPLIDEINSFSSKSNRIKSVQQPKQTIKSIETTINFSLQNKDDDNAVLDKSYAYVGLADPPTTYLGAHRPSHAQSLQDGNVAVTPSSYPTEEMETPSSSYPTEYPSGPAPSYLTLSPSTEPTVQPTDIPSSLPSSEPTELPTDFPTLRPVSPTRFPTSRPSVVSSPSGQPTSQPSRQPTSDPTGQPSFQPSCQPSNQPSSQPTSAPSKLSFRSLSLIANALLSSIPSAVYQSRYVDALGCRNNTFRKIADWNSYLTSIASANQFTPSQFVWYSASSTCTDYSLLSSMPSLSVRNFTCSDPDGVRNIWNALSKSIGAVVPCDEASWVIQRCTDNVMRICRDCGNPCLARSGNQTLPLASRGSETYIVSYALGFALAEKPQIWPQWSQTCVASSSSITASYSLESDGKITCNLLSPSAPALTNAVSLSTTGRVVANIYTNGGQGNFSFTSLPSGSTWQLLCYTESFQQTDGFIFRSPIERSYQSGCIVTTTCCQPTPVVVFSSFSSVVQFSTSPSITVKINTNPSDMLAIEPFASYVGTKPCPSYPSLSAYSTANDTEIVVAPSELTFSSTDTQLSAFFLVQPLITGCFYISVKLAGPSMDKFYTDLSSGIYITSTSYTGSSNVTVTLAAFSSTGARMQVRFSSNTDMGLSLGLQVGVWPCSMLLVFDSANVSTCKFISASAISVTFPSDLSLPLPVIGSVLTLIGGIVRPACSLTAPYSSLMPSCDQVEYIATFSINITSLVSIRPVAAISAPSISGFNSTLRLNLSPSTGNAGRPWSKLVWDVRTIDGTPCTDLQDYMNTVPKWFNCVPGHISCNLIPSNFFLVSQYYVFSLTLQNFFGNSDTTTHVVYVQPTSVPHVRIVGSPYEYRFVNSSFTKQAEVIVSTNDVVTFSWSVYRNGILDFSIADQSIDEATFTVKEYNLIANNEYEFQVAVGSMMTGGYSIATATVFVLPGQIIPILVGGDYKGIVSSGMLTVDASSSYETSTGSSSTLSYSWKCLQSSPLSTNGCSSFFSYLQETSQLQNSLISIPASIMSFPATYKITVIITSSVIASTTSITQTVDIQPDIALTGNENSLASSITLANIPGKVDNTIPTLIDAQISFASAYTATWTLISSSTINTTTVVKSNTFLSIGHADFPLLLPAGYLVTGSTYTFQLSVSAYGCTSKCLIGYSSILVVINNPPNAGQFRVDPTSGSDVTLFSVFVSNWQDVDLPITSSFFQHNSQRGANFLLKQQSSSSFITTLLAAGDSSNGNAATLIGYIFDAYNCKAVVEATAYVSSSSQFTSSKLSTSSRSLASTSFDHIQALLSIAIAQKNSNLAFSIASILSQNEASTTCSSPSSFVDVAGLCYSFGMLSSNALNTIFALADLDGYAVVSLTESLNIFSANLALGSNAPLLSLYIASLSKISTALSSTSLSDIQSFNIFTASFYNSAANMASTANFNSMATSSTSRQLESSSTSTTDKEQFESSVWSIVNSQYSKAVIGSDAFLYVSDYFDVFVRKTWQQTSSLLLDYQSLVVLSDESDQLLTTSTAKIGQAIFISRIPSSSATEDKFLIAASDTYYVTLSYESNVPFSNPSISTQFPSMNTTIQPVVDVRSVNYTCPGTNSTDTILVVCFATESGSVQYTVPITCQRNVRDIVQVKCPAFNLTTECLVNNQVSSDCKVVAQADGSKKCVCPTTSLGATLNSDSTSLSITSSFAVNQRVGLTSLAAIRRFPIPSNPLLSQSKSSSSVNYITIVAIVVGLVIAFGFGGKKLYDMYVSNDSPVQTQAAVVGADAENQSQELGYDHYVPELKILKEDEIDVSVSMAEAVAVPLQVRRVRVLRERGMIPVPLNEQAV
jgi:hypothetical protein